MVQSSESSPIQQPDSILGTVVEMCLGLISGATRCRCAGIRVNQEGDFPLVRNVGFSEEFVESERSLLPAGVKAELSPHERLDLLECLCGRVIRGERGCCEELFTAKGCLWTNDFCETGKIPPHVRAAMRRACLEENFRSFALVPCRPDHETLALLQICDRRGGLLSEGLVEGLEKAAEQFARLLFQLRRLKKTMSRVVGTRPIRILIVDDDEEMSSVLEDTLNAKGHLVTSAPSGPEALEILSREKVDVVVTDFNMPDMTGLALAVEIHNRWDPYAPPIILMSGTFSREMVFPENELSDVAAFLAKPFSEETLMEAIRNALS